MSLQPALLQALIALVVKFQWPLNGHMSLQRNQPGIQNYQSGQSWFQWPLNGHMSLQLQFPGLGGLSQRFNGH